jgi:catechol 2,3-dioxygenase-like lactoylglutathione lyase family enzyme
MRQSLATIALVVRDYDEAIAWFTGKLGFVLEQDIAQPGKRWVVVAPRGGTGARLLLARADGPKQETRIGDQTGGRVFLFLETDDFDRDHSAMKANGIRFLEEPRREAYGTVAVFEDLYGNKWDLLEPKR